MSTGSGQLTRREVNDWREKPKMCRLWEAWWIPAPEQRVEFENLMGPLQTLWLFSFPPPPPSSKMQKLHSDFFFTQRAPSRSRQCQPGRFEERANESRPRFSKGPFSRSRTRQGAEGGILGRKAPRRSAFSNLLLKRENPRTATFFREGGGDLSVASMRLPGTLLPESEECGGIIRERRAPLL